MDSLNDTGLLKLLNGLSYYLSVIACKYKLSLTGSRNPDLDVLINITIGMAAKNNRLFPAAYSSVNIAYKDRLTENSSVKLCTDNSVRAWSELLEVVFFYACLVRSDCCTLNTNMKAFDSRSCIVSNFIIRIIAAFEPKVVILSFQINIRQKEFVLDNLP